MIPFRTTAETHSHAAPVATVGLILTNIAVFLFMADLAPEQGNLFIYSYSLVPRFFSESEAARQLDLAPYHLMPLITNTFLHGGFLHLILNMWMLWLFGAPLEGRLGFIPFLFFYLLAGAAGSAGHLVTNWGSPIPALGASGAIAGVLGGFTYAYPKAKVAIVQPIFFFPLIFHLPALLFTGFWFAIQIIQGLAAFSRPDAGQAGGIAWWAHIGGFVVGLVLVIWFEKGRSRKRRFRRRGGPWG